MATNDSSPPDSAARANPYRQLPAVNVVVDSPALTPWAQRSSRTMVVQAARRVLAAARRELAEAGPTAQAPSLDEILCRVTRLLEAEQRPRLRPTINATGIILHTGLGRAPLADEALRAVQNAAHAYCSLELELERGVRGKRVDLVRELLCRLTGSEAATVVNNNAAATLITLATLAAGRSVIVSRGELIEIGGSFRLPEIMQASGAQLREVGTTNKTRTADYERAIDESTAALMKVHTSNYRIDGFTESVSLADLVALGRRHGLPVIHDIGSGALVDFGRFGFGHEPVAGDSVAAGAELILFSGDKLLGGPQAGIILGRRQWIERIDRQPLSRACRVDKMTLAALEATLRLYLDPDTVCQRVPVLCMVSTPLLELRERAHRLAQRIGHITAVAELTVDEDTAFLGGGSVPQQGLPTVVLRLRFRGRSETDAARLLRLGHPPVVPRLQDGRLVLDLRTVLPDQFDDLVQAIETACQRLSQ